MCTVEPFYLLPDFPKIMVMVLQAMGGANCLLSADLSDRSVYRLTSYKKKILEYFLTLNSAL